MTNGNGTWKDYIIYVIGPTLMAAIVGLLVWSIRSDAATVEFLDQSGTRYAREQLAITAGRVTQNERDIRMLERELEQYQANQQQIISMLQELVSR